MKHLLMLGILSLSMGLMAKQRDTYVMGEMREITQKQIELITDMRKVITALRNVRGQKSELKRKIKVAGALEELKKFDEKYPEENLSE